MFVPICLIIIAWVTAMPLWASITITVMSGVAILLNMLVFILKLVEHAVE